MSENDRKTAHKRAAAELAVSIVESGMVVGLGEGSSAAFALPRLAQRIAAGELHDIACVACSSAVEARARAVGLTIVALTTIDLTIDGADEVDPALAVIKGRGGALLREKIVAAASRREIIVVDESKLSEKLGTLSELPVEVFPFGARAEEAFLRELGAAPTLRMRDGVPFVTDEGNHILDCRFAPLDDAPMLARQLDARPGIAAHGLFIDLVTELFVGGDAGVRRHCR